MPFVWLKTQMCSDSPVFLLGLWMSTGYTMNPFSVIITEALAPIEYLTWVKVTVLSALHVLIYFTLTLTLWQVLSFPFIVAETESCWGLLLAQGHMANKWKGQDLNPGTLSSKPALLSNIPHCHLKTILRLKKNVLSYRHLCGTVC